MGRKYSIQKTFSLIFMCGLLILILAGTHNQVNSQTQLEEHFVTEPTPTPDPAITMIEELLKIFFSMPSGLDSESTSPASFPSGSPPASSPPPAPKPTFTSLREIFKEIGEQIGVSPLILEAVMLIEMPSTFNFTEEQIREYSTPGNVIPGCGPNICAATGPMQMTIGVDDTGNSLCPKCCWKGECRDTKGGCPNAWTSYGSGNPCNLKDNVYGAARKLKKDSGAVSADNWTQDQVYQAARRYYGDCTAAYSRLGGRTYCEYVWWYYNTN